MLSEAAVCVCVEQLPEATWREVIGPHPLKDVPGSRRVGEAGCRPVWGDCTSVRWLGTYGAFPGPCQVGGEAGSGVLSQASREA